MTPEVTSEAGTTARLIEKAGTWSAHNYHPLPVVLARGEGVWVYDPDGTYMDMLSAYSALTRAQTPEDRAGAQGPGRQDHPDSRAFTTSSSALLREAVPASGWRWRS